MALPWYCTREDVKTALDFKETARNNRLVDQACGSASRAIEALTHRRFYPEYATRYFDWPNDSYSRAWRLWLDRDELVSLTTLENTGVATIDSADVFLNPSHGPPYTYLELNTNVASSAAFGGASTTQRAVSLTGIFGYRDERAAAGEVVSTIGPTVTTLDVTDSSEVGVGTLLVGTDERIFVTARSMLTTGTTLNGNLAASMAGQSVTVASGTVVHAGETIMIDAEKMLVNEIAGNVLLVTRAWDGTTLAAHTGTPVVYAPRRLTVERGAVGSTAVTQLSTADLERQVYPELVVELAIAEASTTLLQKSAGYGRVVGSGENQREMSGKGIVDLRRQVRESLGKQARKAAV
jgi:hypothetical protein